MECEIAIIGICSILKSLPIKIQKLIECDMKLLNVDGSEYQDSFNASRNLIKILNHLTYVMKIRMRTSPTTERERASELANAVLNGRKTRVEAEKLLNLLKLQNEKHESCVNNIKMQITEEKLLLEQLKKNYEREIAEIINESRHITEEMRQKTLIDEIKLKAEIDLKSIEFKCISEKNLENEKELYRIRKKAELEYLEILTKYDENVGGLYDTMEFLIQEFDSLNTNLKSSQERLIIQNTEYEMLNNEKNSKIQKLFNENLTKFLYNRAAKIIQRAWRKHMERLLLRKKKKSKRKKNLIQTPKK